MRIKVKVFNKPVADASAEVIGKVVYDNVSSCDVFAGIQFTDGVLDCFGEEKDPFDEYLRIQFADDTHAVFRSNYVVTSMID